MATSTTSQPSIDARSGLGLRAHRAGKYKANYTDMAVDMNLFDARWHELFAILVKELDGLRIEPGEGVNSLNSPHHKKRKRFVFFVSSLCFLWW